MEHRAFAGLIIRITGVVVIVSTITNSARSFVPFFDPVTVQRVGLGLLLFSALVSVVLPILLGLVLVYFPGTITTRVFRIEGLDAGSEDDTRSLQRVAFATIGVWLAAYALIDAVYVYAKARLYFRILEEMPAYSKPPVMSPDDFGSLVSSCLQLLIGLWLLLGNRGIVSVLARLRG